MTTTIRASIKSFAIRAAIFISILVGIEIALRAFGAALLSPQNAANKIRTDDRKKLRILTIGESTTADLFGEGNGGSWPRILEKKLNDAGIPTRIYNEAVSGTSSPFLVQKLPGYLDFYDPHIVISMMGINDNGLLILDESWKSKLEMSVERIRLVKLARWTRDAIQAQLKCEVIDHPRNWNTIARYTAQVRAAEKEKSPEQIKDDLLKELSPVETAFVLTEAAIQARGPARNDVDNSMPHAYANLAFELYPYDQTVAFWKLSEPTPKMCEEAIAVLAPCGNNVPDKVLARLTDCATFDRDFLNDPSIRARGMMLAPTGQSPTAHHYDLMIQLLKNRRVSLVAMQYPTLSIEALKQTITAGGAKSENIEGVVLVTNQENFELALKKYQYHEIFTDRFRGSWGHTTTRGHTIIADNVFGSIEKMWMGGCCR